MSPGTNIGAAHPVQASGKDVGEGKAGEKIISDTVAFIESIAEVRQRDSAMARSFVISSLSITAQEALEHGVIDLVAPTLKRLLADIDAREVTQNDTQFVLNTTDSEVVEYQPSLSRRLLELLGNPNLFYLLFLAGIVGLGFELTHPGALFPGIFGGISLLLALIATSVLPVSFGAAALVLLGFALLIAEMYVPSFGLLGLGGVAAFLIGSIFLVDPADAYGMRVSWYAIAPSVVLISALGLFIGYLVTKILTADAYSKKSIVGKQAVVHADFSADGTGQVKIAGETWNASTDASSPPRKGDKVEILQVEGLQLHVKPQGEQAQPQDHNSN